MERAGEQGRKGEALSTLKEWLVGACKYQLDLETGEMRFYLFFFFGIYIEKYGKTWGVFEEMGFVLFFLDQCNLL